MKDYLKEELSEEERLIIQGIIWQVSRRYKHRVLMRNNRICEFIDNRDLITEDTYTLNTYNLVRNTELKALSEKEKCDMVMNMDFLLRELCLFVLIGTLTFNEKLVFFLYYLDEYKSVEIAKLLNKDRKTIFRYRKALDKKIEEMRNINERNI